MATLPVVLIITVNQVIPVTAYANTFQKDLKKNLFPEVYTKKYAQNSLSVYSFDVKMETTIRMCSDDDVI